MNILSNIAFILAIFWGSIAIQDTLGVPNAVKHAFTRNFDIPADVAWKKTTNGYEVDFNLSDVEHAARYTPNGELLMVKMALDEQDLPPAIRQRIVDDFRQFEIDKIDQVKAADRLLIQVALNGPSENRKVVFTPDGQVDGSVPYWD